MPKRTPDTEPPSLRAFVFQDFRANRRDPLAQVLLMSFRFTQFCMGDLTRPRPISLPIVALYRLLSEIVFSTELRPRTSVGPGLTFYHRTGTVVNDHTVIGRNVTLRHGVTIGHKVPGGPSPVIENDVTIGAGAIILGGIRVGAGAVIAGGAVVVVDVESGQVVAGNPARPISTRPV
jgi:putative colanic acid biosynthesis acetyltransferase WcaB